MLSVVANALLSQSAHSVSFPHCAAPNCASSASTVHKEYCAVFVRSQSTPGSSSVSGHRWFQSRDRLRVCARSELRSPQGSHDSRRLGPTLRMNSRKLQEPHARVVMPRRRYERNPRVRTAHVSSFGVLSVLVAVARPSEHEWRPVCRAKH